MRIILTQDVKALGRKGDTLEVATGYARNYLIPRGIAQEASAGAVKALSETREVAKKKQDRVLVEAQKAAEELSGLVLTVYAKVGEGRKLFGSVTAKDVAEGIARVARLEVDRRKVELEEPIKSLGQFQVSVRLHPQVVARVRVDVRDEAARPPR